MIRLRSYLRCSFLQCVAVLCIVRVAVCCNVFWDGAMEYIVHSKDKVEIIFALQCVAVCCSVVQCACCSVLQCLGWSYGVYIQLQ